MKKIPIQNIIEENEEEFILKQNKDKKYVSPYTEGKSDFHKVGGVYPCELRDRILKNYLGKPFDDAFSEYCKQVPKYQQHFFLEYFASIRLYSYYIYQIDENGLIQKRSSTHQKPKKVVLTSADYKFELRHKISGRKKSTHYWDYPFTDNNYKSKYPNATSYYQAMDFYNEEFEPVTISGWIREFESKKDPEYKRLMSEKLKELRKIEKLRNKEKEEKTKSLLTIQEDKKKEEIEKNLLKIKKLGFDPDTSFHKDPEII